MKGITKVKKTKERGRARSAIGRWVLGSVSRGRKREGDEIDGWETNSSCWPWDEVGLCARNERKREELSQTPWRRRSDEEGGARRTMQMLCLRGRV